MAQRGGARPGAGRKKGAVSKAKRDIAEMAKEHAETALGVLVSVATNLKQPAAARVSAATALLDRGFGKPAQAVKVGEDPENPLPPSVIQLVPATMDANSKS